MGARRGEGGNAYATPVFFSHCVRGSSTFFVCKHDYAGACLCIHTWTTCGNDDNEHNKDSNSVWSAAPPPHPFIPSHTVLHRYKPHYPTNLTCLIPPSPHPLLTPHPTLTSPLSPPSPHLTPPSPSHHPIHPHLTLSTSPHPLSTLTSLHPLFTHLTPPSPHPLSTLSPPHPLFTHLPTLLTPPSSLHPPLTYLSHTG